MNTRKRLFRRQLRTVFLALAATATFAWSAIDIFDADPNVLWGFFKMSLVGLLLLVLVGGFLATLLRWVRR
jgi:hypothetical protein